MTTKNYDDSGSVSSPPKPRWYCLSIDGAAPLCIDQADAVETAADADLAFPNCAPHRIHSEKIEDDQTRDATFAVANDGMIAMNKMRDRYLAHGKLGFTGLELRAVLDTLDLYGQLLVHCTRGQLVDALKQAEKEMRCPPQEEKEAA